mgnify:CR=1 FL=1
MNLFQQITHRSSVVGLPLGPIAIVLCEGRCCGNRTAPLFISLGVRGALMLCGDCRAWQQRIIRAVLPEIRRAK